MIDPKLSALENLDVHESVKLRKKTVPEYVQFLDYCKTPELTVRRVIDMVKKEGLEEFTGQQKFIDNKRGFYMTDADKKQFAIVLKGKQRCYDYGVSILGAHTDAPCLNLRGNPIEEGTEGVILKTKPYGGIWEHQHVDYTAKLIGHITKKQGEITFNLEGLLSDRGIHISKEVNELPLKKAFPHEMFKFITGFSKKESFLKVLERKGLDEKDFYRGSWYIVPADKVRILGDGLIDGYGHDDRICVFASVKAALDSKELEFPLIVYGCDREEIGSTGLSGAQSTFLDSAIYNLLSKEFVPERDISLGLMNRIYNNSLMISSDVDIALTSYDSQYQDPAIATRFNRGIAIVKSNGGIFQSNGNQASNQIVSYLMDLFDENNVMYQMSECPSKLQKGGEGTIAKYFAQKGIQVIDVGVPVGNMHGKHPTAHIGDLGQLIKGYSAFIGRR